MLGRRSWHISLRAAVEALPPAEAAHSQRSCWPALIRLRVGCTGVDEYTNAQCKAWLPARIRSDNREADLALGEDGRDPLLRFTTGVGVDRELILSSLIDAESSRDRVPEQNKGLAISR